MKINNGTNVDFHLGLLNMHLYAYLVSFYNGFKLKKKICIYNVWSLESALLLLTTISLVQYCVKKIDGNAWRDPFLNRLGFLFVFFLFYMELIMLMQIPFLLLYRETIWCTYYIFSATNIPLIAKTSNRLKTVRHHLSALPTNDIENGECVTMLCWHMSIS